MFLMLVAMVMLKDANDSGVGDEDTKEEKEDDHKETSNKVHMQDEEEED